MTIISVAVGLWVAALVKAMVSEGSRKERK